MALTKVSKGTYLDFTDPDTERMYDMQDAYDRGYEAGYKKGLEEGQNMQALEALQGAVWSYCHGHPDRWAHELESYNNGSYLVEWELYTDDIDSDYLPRYGEWLKEEIDAEKAKENEG